MNKIIIILTLLYSGCVFSKDLVGKYEYNWIESDLCNNKFEIKYTENYKKARSIKKKLGFLDYSRNWVYNNDYCLIVESNNKKYVVRRLLDNSDTSALYIVFSTDNAYGVYGRYLEGVWVVDKAFYKKVDIELMEILDFYLLKNSWMK